MEECEWTSNRLRKEGIYIEYYKDRYELVRETDNINTNININNSNNNEIKYDKYRFSTVIPIEQLEEKLNQTIAAAAAQIQPPIVHHTAKGRGRQLTAAAQLAQQAAQQQQMATNLHAATQSIL